MIRLILVDGDPEGLRSAAIVGRTTVLWAAPWVQMKAFLGRPEANRPAVYFMVGAPLAGATTIADQAIYIGECDSLAERFNGKHHQSEGAEWSQIFLATTTEGTFNKAHARHAEDRLVHLAKSAGRALCLNGGTSPGQVDEGDRAFAREFAANAIVLAQTLGLSLFRPAVSNHLVANKSEVTNASTDPLPTFRFAYKGAPVEATMVLDGSEFVIKIGSQVQVKEMDGIPDSIRAQRIAARNNGLLVPTDNPTLQMFVNDFPMKSTSAAGSMIYGSACQGPVAWHDTLTGKSYKDWVAAQLESIHD